MIDSLTTVQKLIESNQFSVFLVDAAGVLYNQPGHLIEGVPESIQAMQDKGNVFLMTNNSWKSCRSIEKWCHKNNLNIKKDHILSSGLGVEYDEDIRSKIEDKRVYVVGGESSLEYLENVSHKLVSTPEEAQVWVLMAWPAEEKEETYNELIRVGKTNSDIQIICCNPDQHIYINNQLMPVVGYWAKKLGEELDRQIHWMGKPYSNFAHVVKKILLDHHQIEIDDKCIFFDDNPANVSNAKKELGLTSCLVKDTGLSTNKTLSSIKNHPEYDIDWMVSSLNGTI